MITGTVALILFVAAGLVVLVTDDYTRTQNVAVAIAGASIFVIVLQAVVTLGEYLF